MTGERPIRPWWSVLALAATAFFVAYSSPIDFTYSDPWGNLLTAQAIFEHGTIKLDAYPEAHALSELRLVQWALRDHSLPYRDRDTR